MNQHYFLYILRCSDDSYYVGITRDLTQRIQTHIGGKGPIYTAQHQPVQLLYSEKHESLESVRSRERQIKRWSRAKKEALVCGNIEKLKKMSKRRFTKPSKKPLPL